MGSMIERYFIPTLVGLAPVLFALLTWGPNGFSGVQNTIRIDAAPVFAIELVVFVVACREGLLGWLRANPPPPLVIAALAIWLAVTIIASWFVAPDQLDAIRWTVHWIVHLLFGFSIAFLCSRMLQVRDFIACYLAGFILYVAIFLVFVSTYWGQPIDWIHNLPGAIHIRHIGIYAAAMTGMSIGAMAAARGWREWLSAFAVATVGFALGLWTGSRGMALSVAAATAIGVMLIPEMRSPRVWAAGALSLLIGTVAVAWLPVPNSNMMGVARTVAATIEHEMTTGRTQIWVNVIHAIARQPVFGYGPGQMAIVAPFYGMAQPHNFILQVLLDWGVVGLVCVIVLAFVYFRKAIPALHWYGARLAPPFIAMMSTLALSMIDAAMYHVLPVSIFAACAGMVAADWRVRAERP